MPHPGKNDKDEIAQEAKPDDLPCPAIAIDLSQDVAEDIAYRENNDGRWGNEGAKAYHLYGNDIGRDKTGDEDGNNDDKAVRPIHG